MKKFISIFLLFALLASVIPIAFAAPICAQCGKSLQYNIYCATCEEYKACPFCGLCDVCGPDTLHNSYDGTMVAYDAEDRDGDGIKDVFEEYTVTVPAQLAPGEQGNVTASGRWPSNRILNVQADAKVTLMNSINNNESADLQVDFPGIELVGSNTQSVTDTKIVSVADMSPNALFGVWSGVFYYTVNMVTDPSSMEAYALLLDNADDENNPRPMIFIRTERDIAVGDIYNSSTYGELPVTHVYQDFEHKVSSGPSSIMGVRPWQDDADLVTSVVFEETVKPLATGSWFNGFENCKTFDVAKLDVSQVPTTRYMFASCESVEELDLSMWNVSKVTSIDTMFSGCYALKTVDFTNWDTDQITDMSYTFCACTGLTGELELNFNPTWYQRCFWNVDFSAQNLTLTGNSYSLDTLGSTGNSYCSICNGVCVGH